ncbi:MAG: carboxypeptidase regulatory-like domain-containing protein, partial [Chloroflexota bacterium]
MKQIPKQNPKMPLVVHDSRRQTLSRLPLYLAVAAILLALCMPGGHATVKAAAPEPTPVLPSQPTDTVVLPVSQGQTPSSSGFESAVWPWKQENPEPKARRDTTVNVNEVSSKSVSGDVSATSAAAANNITSAGQFGGASFRVAINGNYAYIGTGFRLSILNIANPAAVSLAGRTQTAWADEVLGIAVRSNITNTYAYIVTGNEGLRVVDASDQKNPNDVGFYNTPGYAWDLAVSGNYAYIADGSSGLQVVDITMPYAPQHKATLDTPGKAMDVEVDARYAYIADENGGLRIVDISMPANPTEVGSLKTNGRAVGLVVSGNTVYLADDTDGLRIIDVTTKTAPKLVGALDTAGNAYSVDFDPNANIVYVADSGDGLRAVDVSTPTAPKEVGHFDISGCWANDVEISGSYAFLVDTAHGLRVLNTTNPSEISPVFLFNTPAPTDVKVSGNYTYLTSGSAGLRIINTSKPAAPVESGYFDTPGYAYAVAVVTPPGSSTVYALVADWDKGLRVIDVTTPNAPHEVGFRDTPGMARDVAVLYPYAYVADSNQGLQIINITDPLNPVITAACDQVTCMPSGGEARGIIVAPSPSDSKVTYAYVADGSMGLRLIDVSDPLHPTQLGFYDTPGEANRVALSPQAAYAYVADGFGGGVQVVDVSNPTSLVSLGAYDTDGSANAIISVKSADLGGDYLFLADGNQGLRLILVEMVSGSRPKLSEKAFYDTRGWAGSLSVVGQRAYIADGEDGLNILDTTTEKVLHTISGKVVSDQGVALPGVTISAGTGLITVTAANGTYSLGGLMSQDYTITPALSGYLFSPSSFTVNLKEDIKDKNFTASQSLGDGYMSSGVVVDANGSPISGVTVTLTADGSSAQAVQSAVTDAKGVFTLKGLASSSTYTIVPQKEGFEFSPATRALAPTLGTANQQDTTLNQQFVGKMTGLAGIVKDNKEMPIADVTITSDCSEKASSDAEGKYTLTPAKVGSCTLIAIKDGYTFVPLTRTVQIPSAASQDFQGVPKTVISISGSVLDKDGKPLKDVKLTSDCSLPIVTDERGIYILNDVKGKSCSLAPALDGYTFSPDKLTVIIPEGVVGQQTAAGQRFTGVANVISGRVIDADGKPLAGVNLTVNGGIPVVTNEQGIYTLNGLSTGSYTLVPQKSGINFSPPRQEFNLPANSTKMSDFIGRQAVGSVKGKVKDGGGIPVAGVVISDGAGHQIFSDQNGDFQFNLPSGTVTLSAAKEGYTFSPATAQLVLPPDVGNVEFIALANDYQVSGKVSDKNGNPLIGVALNNGSAASITPDQNGNYNLLLKAGTYTIKPSKDGYSFTPPSLEV